MMLAADIAVLPEPVIAALQDFYQLNLEWLSRQLKSMKTSESSDTEAQQASFFLACLHGALLGARSLNDHQYFEQAIGVLGQQLHLDEGHGA